MASAPRSARLRQQRIERGGQPANPLLIQGGRSRAISRTGGSVTGNLSNWTPQRLSWRDEGRQRERVGDRANDLVSNDPHGCSLIEAISVNTVGPGLWPQSKPNHKRLGISEEQAVEIAEQAEWEFERFNIEADARGVADFYGIQFQNLWSMLVNGEFLNLPLILSGPGYDDRRYRLALQVLDPLRLSTPADLQFQPDIRDGIRMGGLGDSRSYFLADAVDCRFGVTCGSGHYTELPRKAGHCPVVMHRFFQKYPEQNRGVFGMVLVKHSQCDNGAVN